MVNTSLNKKDSVAKEKDILIERTWAMPNKNTFSIKPIKELILEELTDGLWIDPFANSNKLATITNDLNQEFDTDYNLDALDFLKMFDDCSIDGILYDPPYSPRQVSECYNDVGYNVTWDTTKASFWGNHKKEISRIVKDGGKVITFGWNSGGIGMKYGFSKKRILLVAHGGWHNDTICTVEAKDNYHKKNIMKAIRLKEENSNFNETQNYQNDKHLINYLVKLPSNFWDFKNESTRDFTHGIHTYPAVMVSPISRNILSIVKNIQPINTLLDPFMGSGTVLVEGQLSNINHVYGNDLNPLAVLISKVKTTPLDIDELCKLEGDIIQEIEDSFSEHQFILENVTKYILNELGLDITGKKDWGENASEILTEYIQKNDKHLKIPNFKNIGYWFKPNVIIELQLLKNIIENIEHPDIRDFMLVAFSEIIRLVSNRRNGEFKLYRLPIKKVISHNPNVKEEFVKKLRYNIERMREYNTYLKSNQIVSEINIVSQDTRSLKDIEDNSIDLMITSPPYGDSRTTVAYGQFSRLSLQWLNLYETTDSQVMKLDSILMGGKKFRNGFELELQSQTLRNSLSKIKDTDLERAGDVYSFYKDLDESLKTISKKMKKNSYQFWVVGNRTVKLEILQTDKIISELGERYGLIHVHTIDRNISNKVMPSQNSPTNISGKKVGTMTNEHIVILRKK